MEACSASRLSVIHFVLLASAALTLAGCQSVIDNDDFAPGSKAPSLTAAPGAQVSVAELRSGPSQQANDDNKALSVVRRALLQNPALREKAGQIAVSQEEVTVQRAAFYPQISAGVTGGVGDTSSGKPSLEITGEQLITDFGVTRRAVKAADVAVQIRYREFQQAVDDAIIEILNAQANVLMNAEIENIRAAQLARMRELQRLVAQRRDAGATSAPDLLETKKRIEQAEFEFLEARLTHAEARTTLMKLAGTPEAGRMPPMAISGECRSPGLGSNVIQMAQLEVAKAKLSMESADRARLPRLAVAPVIQQPLAGGDVRVGLDLRVGSNLFQGGAIKARSNAARNALGAAEAGLEDAVRQEVLTNIELSRNLTIHKERTMMLERQLKIASEARELYRAQYFDLGTRSLKDLLDNEDDYFGTQAQMATSQYEYEKNLYRCASVRQELRGYLGIREFSLHGYSLDE